MHLQLLRGVPIELRRLIPIGLAALAAAMAPVSTGAQALSVTAEARFIAGLDPETRQLFESLPATVRIQIETLFADLEPKIKADVRAFSDLVQTKVYEVLDRASCTAKALAPHSQDVLFKPYDAIKVLEESRARIRSDVRASSSPWQMELEYASFIAKAQIASCDVSPQRVPMRTVSEMIQDANWRSDVWHRTKVVCDEVQPCFEKLRAYVHDAIARADPRDVANAKAIERLDRVAAPPWSAMQQIGRRFVGLDLGSYEATFKKLLDVQDDVENARRLREGPEEKPQEWMRKDFNNVLDTIPEWINTNCAPRDQDGILATVSDGATSEHNYSVHLACRPDHDVKHRWVRVNQPTEPIVPGETRFHLATVIGLSGNTEIWLRLEKN